MDYSSLLVVLVVLLLFGLIVYLMIRTEQRRRGDRVLIAEALGFKPLQALDDNRSPRLVGLHQHSQGQDIKVENLAIKAEGPTTFFLFDLIDYSGDSVSTLVDQGVAVFSDELAMPRFSLMPRVAEEGRLAEIANRFLEMLVTKRSDHIELGTNEHFDQRYFLLTQDEPGVQAFLDEFRQSRLAQEKYRHLEADGNCFTYSRFVFASRGKRNRRDELKRDLAESRTLLALFS